MSRTLKRIRWKRIVKIFVFFLIIGLLFFPGISNLFKKCDVTLGGKIMTCWIHGNITNANNYTLSLTQTAYYNQSNKAAGCMVSSSGINCNSASHSLAMASNTYKYINPTCQLDNASVDGNLYNCFYQRLGGIAIRGHYVFSVNYGNNQSYVLGQGTYCSGFLAYWECG